MAVIGLDIGGTSIKGAVIDGSGVVHRQSSGPTEATSGREHIFAQLCSVTDALFDAGSVTAIGVGSAGRIDANRGSVYFATDNLPGWTGFRLAEALTQRYGVPTFVDNDANAAAMGESWLGAAAGKETAVLLTLGTGVGGGLISRGEVIRGAHWSAGELGHVVLHPGGQPCNCGLTGCAEQYVSGSALMRQAAQSGLQVGSGAELMTAYEQGDVRADPIVRRFVEDLVLLLINIQQFYDPDVIVLGGGVADSRNSWAPALMKAVQSLPIPMEVVWSLLGNHAGMFGAAKFALDGKRK